MQTMSSRVRVISFKICPFVQRVTGALEAKGVKYDIDFINLKNKPQWFLDLSPTGQVPLLLTKQGTALFESDAIVEYIDDEFGPLEEPPKTPEEKALDRAWCYQASKHYLVQCGAMRSPDEETLNEKAANLGKAFARVEGWLNDSRAPFFHGKALGKVDVAWLPLLHRASIVEKRSGFNFLESFPKVQKWQAALLQTGLAEKSVPEDFERAFSEFYLSPSTFLGQLAQARI